MAWGASKINPPNPPNSHPSNPIHKAATASSKPTLKEQISSKVGEPAAGSKGAKPKASQHEINKTVLVGAVLGAALLFLIVQRH